MFRKLKKGRDKEGEWGKNDDKVIQAVEDGDIEKLQAALSKKGTSPIKMDPDGRVPLHLAAELGQFGCLDIMIQYGATVAAADSQGYTVLHYASMGGHTDCVQRLVLAQAPLNARELTGKTALHLSVLGGHLDCCKILLKARASINVTEEYGKTPLLMAAQLGHLDICKDLIDKGANVNAGDHLQRTALMLACERGHKDIVELLVKRGAVTGLKDAQGFDAAHYARDCGDEDLKKCLESAPSVATWDVKSQDEEDDEPKADSIDFVDSFDVQRCETPVPKSPRQQNGSLHKSAMASQQSATSKAKSASHSKEIKEMEEENEVLYDELSRVTLDHKKALEKIKALEQKLQDASMGHGDNLRNQEFEEEFEHLKNTLQTEKDKRAKAEAETEMLKARLASVGGDVTEDDTEIDSNWGDSDDDLFDLPGTGGSPVKVKPAKRIDTTNRLSSESTGLVAILRSQIVSLCQENEELKKKLGPNISGDLEDGRVGQLEEELSSLREELDVLNSRDVVSVEEYNELKEASRLELAEYQKNNGILMDEIANMSQRLAVYTDENERLKRKATQDGRKTPVQSENSALQRQFEELQQEQRDLRETVARHKQAMEQQADESEELKAKIVQLSAENQRLEEVSSKQAQNGPSVRTEDYEALTAENVRLESTVTKQSKAIAQQNERARREKQKYTELLAEHDKLRKEMLDSRNGTIDDIDKEKYDDLIEENHRLRQSVKTQEDHIASSPDKDRYDHLSKDNWRLQDEIRKQDDEMVLLRRELRKFQQNGHSTGEQQDLRAENRKLRDKIEALQKDDGQRAEEARRFAELLVENNQLQQTIREQAEAFESHLPASVGFSKKRYTELLAENRKLKAQVQKEAIDGGSSRVKDLKEVVRLQQKLQEAETKYTQMVSLYRSHLLGAIQDDLNPKVRESLVKITKIRRGEEFV